MSSDNKHPAARTGALLYKGIGVLTPSTSGLSPSCDLEEINIGFELQDGADWRQRSLTGQTGSDGLTYRANRREVLGSLLRDPL